ncbi:DUF4411 family protein [Fructobacillus ficulneus]|uniref:DUF4411 family protein n=1 Tax=Fructobacillus ficulneus TaxID=157463 RepID=A0A0K8MGF8_9LACO|nr:DUF4411 family protein [Fructobacillus ficulneus]GAO99620.1 hypothetical protein FFIC_231060 [Fructobacillus ficulneus]
MKQYLLDANILINANRYYRQKFFPVIWRFFKNNQKIHLLDKVYNEIIVIDDELSCWLRKNYDEVQINSSNSIAEYKKVVDYLVTSQLWSPAGYESWIQNANKADPWIISSALKHDFIIVSEERKTGPNGMQSSN